MPHSNQPVVFLGGPFKGLLSPATGTLPDAARARYARLIEAFERAGWLVLSAHRAEGWGARQVSDRECTRRDWAWMHRCDVFVAFPGDPPSPGTHVELGWASALGRPAIVLTEPGAFCAALVAGLAEVGPVQVVEYRDDEPGALDVLARAGRTAAGPARGREPGTRGPARARGEAAAVMP